MSDWTSEFPLFRASSHPTGKGPRPTTIIVLKLLALKTKLASMLQFLSFVVSTNCIKEFVFSVVWIPVFDFRAVFAGCLYSKQHAHAYVLLIEGSQMMHRYIGWFLSILCGLSSCLVARCSVLAGSASRGLFSLTFCLLFRLSCIILLSALSALVVQSPLVGSTAVYPSVCSRFCICDYHIYKTY